MSDPLTDAASAISSASPNIRNFALMSAQRTIADEQRHQTDVANLDDRIAALDARLAALEQPAPAPQPSGFPRQGVSLPLGNIAGKSSTDQDWILDQIVALGAGHPMSVRTDWFPPGTTLGDKFPGVAAKVASRPSLVLLPILNYPAASRPTVAAFALQAAQLATLGYPVINLLNEPNLGGWTPADAAAWVDAGHKAIAGRAAVMAPAVGFDKGHGHPPADVLAWVQAYAALRPGQELGACTCYGDAEFVDPAWNGWAVIPQMRAALGAQMPFVVVEGGWRVRPNVNGQPQTFTPLDRGTMSDASYQQICVATGLHARDTGRVDSFLAYSLLDDAAPGGYGLVDGVRQPRPAYYSALQAAA